MKDRLGVAQGVRQRQFVAQVDRRRVQSVAMLLGEPGEVSLHAGTAEVVDHQHFAPVAEIAVGKIATDEAAAAGDDDRARRPQRRGRGETRHPRKPAIAQQARQQLWLPVGGYGAHVIVARVEPKPLLRRDVGGQIAPSVPVHPVRQGAHGAGEAARLLHLVPAPRGIAGFGDPDLSLRVPAVEDRAHLAEMHVPAAPGRLLAVPCARKAMKTDRVHQGEQAAFAHQVHPVGIEGRGAAQHRLPAAFAHPMGGAAHHFAEQAEVAVLAPVPIQQVVGLVPQLDMGEVPAMPGQHHVDEIGVVLEHLRRARAAAVARQRRRREVHAGQQVETLCELWKQPVEPVRAPSA